MYGLLVNVFEIKLIIRNIIETFIKNSIHSKKFHTFGILNFGDTRFLLVLQ